MKIAINQTPGTYDVTVYQDSTLIGSISGKAFNTDNYDSAHLPGNSSDGRLMFGSWFSYPLCPASSYGHAYIDNIEVTVP